MSIQTIKYTTLGRECRPYKYELLEDYEIELDHRFAALKSEYVTCTVTKNSSTLKISRGYRWDGASGPAVDTMNWAMPSLVHDAMYQVIRLLVKQGRFDVLRCRREGLKPLNMYKLRRQADDQMLTLLRVVEMGRCRRWYSWLGVRLGGWFAIGYRESW